MKENKNKVISKDKRTDWKISEIKKAAIRLKEYEEKISEISKKSTRNICQ